MGTIVRFPETSYMGPPVTESSALSMSLGLQLCQVGAAFEMCITLCESTELLRRSLDQLNCLVEMIEDHEAREELRARLHTANVKLANSFAALADTENVLQAAVKSGRQIIESSSGMVRASIAQRLAETPFELVAEV